MTARASSSSARHARTRSRPGRRLPASASTAGRRSARTAAPSPRTGCRRTPVRTPRPRSRPSPGTGPPAGRPAQRPAGGGPTPPSGSPPRRRTPPRPGRARGPALRPAPAAAPATSPGPASPPSTPARKTRTASRRAPVPRPAGGPTPPPTPPARHRQSRLHTSLADEHRYAKHPGVPDLSRLVRPDVLPGAAVLPRTTRAPGDTEEHGSSAASLTSWASRRCSSHTPHAVARACTGKATVVSPGPRQEKPGSSPNPTIDS